MPIVLYASRTGTDADIAERVLGTLARKLLIARDVFEAQRLCECIAPGLVILGDAFADEEALKFCAEIRERVPAAVAVIRVASGRAAALPLWAVEPGFDDIIVTPLDPIELAQRCKRALERRGAVHAADERREQIEVLRRNQEEMTALVVHDMKGPLGAVMMNLEFLREDLVDPDHAAALDDAFAACRRLMRITVNLLDLNRIEAGCMKTSSTTVSIAAVVASCLQFRRASAKRDEIGFDVDVPDSLRARFDADLLERVLDNVLDNAMRYVGKYGRVRIWSVCTADKSLLYMANTGPAVPVSKRELIFEKFATTGSSGRMSMGLGLFFCRVAIEEHGGSIIVTELPQLPCVFVIALPLVV